MSTNTPILSATPPRLNKLAVLAAAYALVTALLHVTGGANQFASPLPNSNLDEEVRFTLLAVWHMSSVAICMSAAVLAWSARPRPTDHPSELVRFIAVMWIGFGMCFVLVALTQTGDQLVIKLIGPPILMIPPGLLALAGEHQRGQRR